MQSVTDQVHALVDSLERNHIVALSDIDELKAANASLSADIGALKTANAMLEKQLADRSSALSDTEKQMADATAMVENVANAALAMLRQVRGITGAAPASPIVQTAVAAATPLAPIAPLGVLLTDDMLKPLPSVDALTQHEAVQATVAEIMAGDSGDEQPARTVGKSPLLAAPYTPEQPAPVAEPTPAPAPIAEPPAAAVEAVPEVPAPPIAPAVELSAVDRIRGASASLLPAPTLMNRPALVVDNTPLPMFLQRDTVFSQSPGGGAPSVFM